MNIGEASAQSGLSAKTIRYYEDISLITPPRDANGYRAFHAQDVHKLIFLNRARTLGFSIEECRDLLALYEDQNRASSDVKHIAQTHLQQIEGKITQLQDMHATLSHLIKECAGDNRPNCPILKGLSGNK